MNEHSFAGQKIVVIGAGLAGTLAAIMLSRRGADVEIIEHQEFDPQRAYSNRRSFNITVSGRGQAVLEAAGLWADIIPCTIPITGRMCHIDSKMTAFPYSRDNSMVLYGARRADINAALLNAAKKQKSITLRFGYKLVNLNKKSGSILIKHNDSDNRVVETIDDADFVIAADGVYSAARRMLHVGEHANFDRRYLDWGYREIYIPAPEQIPGSKGTPRWSMPENYLHVWPRGDLMMFALPNPDGSFTGNFIYPLEQDGDFNVAGRMTQIFRDEFPDIYGRTPDIEEQLRNVPVSYFPTQRNSKWYYGDKFVLLGDAAHATVPFYGQGMNSGFESVAELINCLSKFPADQRETAFKAYQDNRKPHTDAVADLSIENFDELRSNFRHLIPQARRRLDVLLHRMFPDSYQPLHMLISHSQMNYRTAIDLCAKRDRKLRWLGMDLLVWLFAGSQLAVNTISRVTTEFDALIRPKRENDTTDNKRATT